LLRQRRSAPVGVVELPAGAGDGLFWQASGGLLRLAPPPPAPAAFSYILELPGEVEIPEIGGRIRLSRQPVAAWMRSGERRRAAIAFPGEAFPAEGPFRVEIRNRRPGDRIRALGAPGMRRLKELLIDHKVPRAERDSLPLLVVDGTVAWVPGVTIDERFRLRDESFPWVAEWIGNPGAGF
jgi:tRNA(Ile)-lysidine synthetase-like protein